MRMPRSRPRCLAPFSSSRRWWLLRVRLLCCHFFDLHLGFVPSPFPFLSLSNSSLVPHKLASYPCLSFNENSMPCELM
ncbi:hypothetical protein BDV11DRAFT_177215 [Aspergillus similis]